MPCKKSPWEWGFYPTLSFNTRQSQGGEELLTNIYIYIYIREKLKLKKLGAHGALFKHIHDVLTKLNNWKLTYNCVCMKQQSKYPMC